MSVKALEDLVKKKGIGIEKIQEFYDLPELLRCCFNPGVRAPDESLNTPEDLIKIINQLPNDFNTQNLCHADREKANRISWVRLFNEQSEITKFFTNYVSDNDDHFLEKKSNQHEIVLAKSNVSVIDEYSKLELFLKTVDRTLFTHIEPINSLARKLEAVRVYELVRELRKIAEFFFEQRNLFFSLKGVGLFVIPFTINFNRRVHGVINHDGRICFHTSQNIFFNGLKIQKIHRCNICQKFLLIASGKDNVDRTCSLGCSKILKNQKQNKEYNSNLALVSEDRTYRKDRKGREYKELRVDQYTEKSFSTKLDGDNVATAIYVAWTETFVALNGGIKRSDREKLNTISTEYGRVILDPKIFESYRPRLINTATKSENDPFHPTEIILPDHVFIYFIRLCKKKGFKKLEQLWRNASYLELKRQYREGSLNWKNENLIISKSEDLVEIVETKIKDNKLMLPFNKSKEHNTLLARCEVLATALVEKLSIITLDAKFYKGLLSEETEVEIIDAKDFFRCEPRNDLDLVVSASNRRI